MTIGERIAQLRKEKNLSQEALGQELNVSRQAISKWESDASLPEVEKLVAMSRLFGVPVGWILGVEEAAEAPPEDGELSEKQLQMVEEIVSRYLAALPEAPTQPQKISRGRKALYGLLGAAVVLFCAVLGYRWTNQVGSLENRYQNLQNQVDGLGSDVSTQLWDMTNRMEEILESQNDLVAAWDSRIQGMDLAGGTITFALSATPKSYVEGMTGEFYLDSGEELVTAAAEYDGVSFTASVTCPLTDEITQTAVFYTGDRKETQLLQTVTDQLRWSKILVYGPVWTGWFTPQSGENDLSEIDANLYLDIQNIDPQYNVLPEELYAGVFLNGEPAAWMERQPRDPGAGEHLNGDIYTDNDFAFPEGTTLSLKEGDQLDFVFLVRDNYGRVYGGVQESHVVDSPEETGDSAQATEIVSDPDWLEAFCREMEGK